MKNKIIMLIAVLSFITLIKLNNSNAEQIDLCISDSEQHAVIVNGKDDCLEDESWMRISGQDLESKMDYNPLVRVSPGKNCNTEGVFREVGVDVNNNGVLDENEIMSTSSECRLESDTE